MKLRDAVNAISDVVQNRPPPLREFDQIYMKVADMVIQADYFANTYRDKNVVFIGDGDSIALSALHLHKQEIIEYGPAKVLVLDFDERIVNAITRFAEHYGFADRISSALYNVADSLPPKVAGCYDAFYSNPPWGASNDGESVLAFLERGMEAVKPRGLGMLVIGDDWKLDWTQEVLRRAQQTALRYGFVVAEMMPQMHLYHLDDAPNLRSCSCLFRHVVDTKEEVASAPLALERRHNFYGKNNPLRYRYVREKTQVNYGRASDESYELEIFEG